MTRPAGWHHSEETRRRISESNVRTKALAREIVPPRKRCAKCGQSKDSHQDFSWRHRKLKHGTSFVPDSYCKECERRRSAANRKKAGEAHRRRQAVYDRRRRQRQKEGHTPLVDPAPFLAWLEKLEQLPPMSESLERRIRDVRSGRQARVRYAHVDEVGYAAGELHLARDLYPDV